MCNRRKKQPRGFTIIELVLSLLLAVVLAVVFLPKDALMATHLDAAAERVKNDLRYAQTVATTTNTHCGIQFLANGNYTVYQQSIATPLTDPLTRQPLIVNVSSEFKNTWIANTLQVEFDPMGKPVLGAGQTLQIGSPQTTVSLFVTPNTGLVQTE